MSSGNMDSSSHGAEPASACEQAISLVGAVDARAQRLFEAPHVIPWQKPTRGPTDIDNLALLCFRCHGELHDTSATLRRGPHNGWYRDDTPRRE